MNSLEPALIQNYLSQFLMSHGVFFHPRLVALSFGQGHDVLTLSLIEDPLVFIQHMVEEASPLTLHKIENNIIMTLFLATSISLKT